MAFAGTVIGRGIIPVSLDPTAIGGQITGLQGAMSGQFGALGKGAGGAFAAAATAAIGVGVAAFKLGEEFDDAFDKIRVGTGATGKELRGLQADFKEVARNGPDSFDVVGTAIADLNTRLGLSGKPLQELSRQLIDLSRITETDLSTNIETVTRVFGDWGVSTDEQSEALDKLFRASQATGPSVDRLAALMTKFGSPLRQLGFDFSTTAALVGKFEKEGVNTELVMGSMRIALGKMARAGEPAQETLARITDEIKNAGSTSEANKKALELFGARAGPDMAAAIREGRFEVRDLYKTIEDGHETIQTATEDTSDFAEEWGRLKNNLKVTAEPGGTAVFSGISDALEQMNKRGIPAFRRFNRETNGGLTRLAFNTSNLAGPVMGYLQNRAIRVWNRVGKTFETKAREIGLTVRQIPGNIRSAFGSADGILYETGTAILDGLWKGMQSKWEAVRSWLQEKIASLSPMARYVLGIKSPSRVFMDIGANLVEGLAVGMEAGAGRVDSALMSIVPTSVAGASASALATPPSQGRGNVIAVHVVNVDQFDDRSAAVAESRIGDQLAFAGTAGRTR